MIVLRGNQKTRIDEKGRLKIPASFRADIEDSWGSDFYVTSITGQSVRIYPLSVWQDIEDRLANTPAFNPTKKKFLDRVNYFGQESSMDKQGRLLIAPYLRESAQMTGEVAVLGKLNFLEVWNDEQFRGRMESEPFTDQDEQALSEMGV
jgi:MraZ protein